MGVVSAADADAAAAAAEAGVGAGSGSVGLWQLLGSGDATVLNAGGFAIASCDRRIVAGTVVTLQLPPGPARVAFLLDGVEVEKTDLAGGTSHFAVITLPRGCSATSVVRPAAAPPPEHHLAAAPGPPRTGRSARGLARALSSNRAQSESQAQKNGVKHYMDMADEGEAAVGTRPEFDAACARVREGLVAANASARAAGGSQSDDFVQACNSGAPPPLQRPLIQYRYYRWLL